MIAADIAPALSASNPYGDHESREGLLIAGTVSAKWAKGSGGPAGDECQNLVAIPFDTTQITSAAYRSNPQPGDPCHPLAAGAHAPAVAFAHQGGGTQTTLGYDPDAGTSMTVGACQTPAVVAWSIMPQNSGKDFKARAVDVAQPLMAGGPVGGNQGGDFIQRASAVRRLTPTECERLQGFPDGWTAIPYRGKPAADGPRYKALGNSMAVNVMRWLGYRIDLVDKALSSIGRAAA